MNKKDKLKEIVKGTITPQAKEEIEKCDSPFSALEHLALANLVLNRMGLNLKIVVFYDEGFQCFGTRVVCTDGEGERVFNVGAVDEYDVSDYIDDTLRLCLVSFGENSGYGIEELSMSDF